MLTLVFSWWCLKKTHFSSELEVSLLCFPYACVWPISWSSPNRALLRWQLCSPVMREAQGATEGPSSVFARHQASVTGGGCPSRVWPLRWPVAGCCGQGWRFLPALPCPPHASAAPASCVPLLHRGCWHWHSPTLCWTSGQERDLSFFGSVLIILHYCWHWVGSYESWSLCIIHQHVLPVPGWPLSKMLKTAGTLQHCKILPKEGQASRSCLKCYTVIGNWTTINPATRQVKPFHNWRHRKNPLTFQAAKPSTKVNESALCI